MNSKSRFLTYLEVGRLLHLMSVLELCGFALMFLKIFLKDGSPQDFSATQLITFCILAILPIFAQLDARCRFQNYKQARDQFIQHGFKYAIISPYLRSRCQRDAILVAAKELGFESKCRDYFYSRRYRWYHILPDIIFARPRVMFSRKFLATTFFAHTYHPQYPLSYNYKRVHSIGKNEGRQFELIRQKNECETIDSASVA